MSAFLFWISKLFSLGSADGAAAFTSAALDASISVNNILAVALRDSTYGAICFTSTAADAFVSDNVCHLSYLLQHISFVL